MKKLFAFVLVSMIIATANSQEDYSNNIKNEFGVNAGFTTGVGLSYRHWMNNFGLQLTAIPIKTDDFFFGSVGLTGLYSLKKTKYLRAYLYLGNNLISLKANYSEYDYNTSSFVNKTEEYTAYNVGFGPGFSFGKIVAYNIMLGYGLYDITDSFNMLPTVEMSIYYMF